MTAVLLTLENPLENFGENKDKLPVFNEIYLKEFSLKGMNGQIKLQTLKNKYSALSLKMQSIFNAGKIEKEEEEKEIPIATVSEKEMLTGMMEGMSNLLDVEKDLIPFYDYFMRYVKDFIFIDQECKVKLAPRYIKSIAETSKLSDDKQQLNILLYNDIVNITTIYFANFLVESLMPRKESVK